MIPSIIFLNYRNEKNISILYIALMNSRNVGVGATLYIAVYKEVKLKSKFWLPHLLFVGMTLLFAYSVTSLYGVFFAWP